MGSHPFRDQAVRMQRAQPGTLFPSHGAAAPRGSVSILEMCPRKASPSHIPEPPSATPAACLSPAAPPRIAIQLPLPGRPLATPTSGSGSRCCHCLCPPAPSRLPPQVPRLARSGSAAPSLLARRNLEVVPIILHPGEAIMTMIITIIMKN